MEKGHAMKDTVLLLDHYDERAQLLHQSFRSAGFTGPVVVIEDNGFFPEDVISVYQYFCGDFSKSGRVPGKARYFNQIERPDYWEVSGNNSGGKVNDLYRVRGNIFYTEPKHKRLVQVVDWKDENGTVRFCDHYNRYGALYARTFFSKDGKRFCKAYFDADGREILLDNFVTQDIILNKDGKTFVFQNKIELTLRLLQELGAMQCRLFYNSLSTPLFVSEQMPAGRQEDVLFWQEDRRDDIPGNMQMILSGGARRTKTIYVQKRDSYEKLIELGAAKEMMHPLGFIYSFSKRNTYHNQALICTNSDRIEKCEELVQALPGLHFHIAALTEMSSKLMALSKYENVTLYPGVSAGKIDELFDACDYYLDINHEAEIVSAVKQAFLHDQLILGFRQTLHNREFVLEEHVFDGYEAMAEFLKGIMGDKNKIDARIKSQKRLAMSEETTAYADLFKLK